MNGVVDIAKNTVSGILRNKLMYLALFLLLLIIVLMITPMLLIAMLEDAGEAETARTIMVSQVVGVFGLWYSATIALGLFLGATAISSEVHSRTIVTVLAKPVERWGFLVGKWLGLQTFLAVFLAVGMLLSIVLLWIFGIHPSVLFWMGIIRNFVMVMLMSSFALLLSTVASPVFAGGATFLLGLLTGIVVAAVDHPWPWVRAFAQVYYYLAPAQMPGNLLAQGFNLDLLNPEYGLYFRVILENFTYGLVLLTLGCVVFAAREVRVR